MQSYDGLDPRSLLLLREAVLRHRESGARRRLPTTLHVGVPGARTLVHTHGPGEDQALRTDLVATMLDHLALDRGGDPPHVYLWLVRSGELSLHDDDVARLAPTPDARAQSEVTGVFAVVTREGWWCPHTGASSRWVRLRRGQ